jgi:hypothetical protein
MGCRWKSASAVLSGLKVDHCFRQERIIYSVKTGVSNETCLGRLPDDVKSGYIKANCTQLKPSGKNVFD